jgi:hypothetical protein
MDATPLEGSVAQNDAHRPKIRPPDAVGRMRLARALP